MLAIIGGVLPPILMAHSVVRDTTITLFTDSGGLYINSCHGQTETGYVDDSNGKLRPGVHIYSRVALPGRDRLSRIAITWPDGHFMLVLPWWFIWIFTGAPLAFLIIRREIEMIRKVLTKSQQPNMCHICGYDLRASPNRCPECGTPREDG